jgi:hypothetical protein
MTWMDADGLAGLAMGGGACMTGAPKGSPLSAAHQSSFKLPAKSDRESAFFAVIVAGEAANVADVRLLNGDHGASDAGGARNAKHNVKNSNCTRKSTNARKQTLFHKCVHGWPATFRDGNYKHAGQDRLSGARDSTRTYIRKQLTQQTNGRTDMSLPSTTASFSLPLVAASIRPSANSWPTASNRKQRNNSKNATKTSSQREASAY